MRYYETMYIVHAALEAGRLKDLIKLINSLLTDKGCEVLYNELWGKKKLAYFIDKQKYGTYILVQFKSDGSGNSSFNMELEHNPNVLAYLTTQIEQNNILTQEADINIQIDGNEKISDKKKTSSAKKNDNDKEAEVAVDSDEKEGSNVASDDKEAEVAVDLDEKEKVEK